MTTGTNDKSRESEDIDQRIASLEQSVERTRAFLETLGTTDRSTIQYVRQTLETLSQQTLAMKRRRGDRLS